MLAGSDITIEISDGLGRTMFKRRTRFVLFPAILVLSSLSAAWAQTWYLDHASDWQSLSDETRNAMVKADKHHTKGKVSKAVRGYDKFLEGCNPTSELYAGALEKQFSIAKQFLAGRKIRVLGIFRIRGYAAGIKITERISRRANNAATTVGAALQAAEGGQEKEKLDKVRARLETIGLDASVAAAQNYEQREKFDLAYLKWLEVFDTYDSYHKEALFRMARCKHLAYKGVEYDVSDLTGRAFSERSPYDGAKGCYEAFKSRYPQEAQRLQVDETIRGINEELALKDFTTGRYYQKTRNKQAANLYYQMVIRDWPGTKAARMAREMLVENLSGKE
ncbi:MAG: outer membrane protein assembly factor BamD [Planctomycetota bacterium]